ncbi:MAG: peptide-methionine (R)-S-oxide reductase MsrB [Planctomycetes bacterium]|nr:peptide-methionine (R)-S-oxide reductase MsrB [Planctomycetota bacterium]
MVGIVLLAGKSAVPDYYFLRLSGPAALVESQATAVRGCLSADPAEEKPYELGQHQAEKEEKVVRTEREWRELLTPDEFDVLRRKGTERPFVNKYHDFFQAGTYACAACGQELFNSDTKFHSGCGWPAFYAAQAGDRVKLSPDFSHGMVRTEVTCARCDSHLGHIFDDAPKTPTGQRYCINSVALRFIPRAPEAGREPPK